MQPLSHNIVTEKTARYYSLGSFNDVNQLWICLHGYAHRAEVFIENFRPILSEGVLIIAPEGLSRFYTKGFGGTVGASWMTREDREHEIIDYMQYICRVYSEVIDSCDNQPRKVILFGFSQGVPAILRVIANNKLKVDEVVMWSGDIPRDLDFDGYTSNTLGTRNWLFYSKSDPIVRQEIYAESESLLRTHSVEYEVINFAGGHEIPAHILQDLAARV